MSKTKNKDVLPNSLLYYPVLFIWHLINKFKINNHYIRNELKHKKGPFIVVANHVSSNDQIVTACATSKRMNYVVAESTYYSKLNKLIRTVKAIPKQQFYSGLNEFRQINSVLKQNGIVTIFPAGLCTADGASTTLPSATGKFIKSLKVDVYAIISHGMYLSNPKWSKAFRKGKVDTECFKVLSKEELNNMSSDEVYNKLNEILTYDDYEWQRNNLRLFKNSTNSLGLENVLYSCPNCNTKFSINNINNSLVCNTCNNISTLNKYGFIVSKLNPEIDTPVIWHNKLIESIKSELKNTESFKYVSNVKFSILNKDKCTFENEQYGIVEIDKEYISIIDSNNNYIYKESVKNFFSLPNIPGEYFDLQNGQTIYRCYPNNIKDVSYITDIIISLYELRKQNY